MEVHELDCDYPSAQEWFTLEGLTDGLPVTIPVVERVEYELSELGLSGDEIVAVLPPRNEPATASLIVANAVMAGCATVHVPAVMAAVRAVAEPEFKLYSIQTTTHPVGPAIIVNGPIRKAGEYNSASGVLGPGWRANASTGRALRLILQNVGGGTPGLVDRATHGFPGKYSFCFAENEEASPWEPLHVTRGYQEGDSCVTVLGIGGSLNILGGDRGEELLDKIARSMQIPGSNDFIYGSGSPLLILSPEHANELQALGLNKAEVRDELILRSALPWNDLGQHSQGRALLTHYNLSVGDNLKVAARAEDFSVVVAGGAGAHSVFCMSFGFNPPVSKQVV